MITGKVPFLKLGYPAKVFQLTIIKKMIMSNKNLPLRTASDFYTIPLHADNTLTQVALQNYLDKKVLKQAGWFYPQLKLLSFKDGTVEIENKLDKTVYIFSLKVETEKLQVSCSCGMPVETICIHAFQALSRMLVRDDLRNLKMFMPNEAAQIVLENKRYFETKPGLNNMFTPKANLGSVYGIQERLAGYNIADVLAMPSHPPTKKEIQETAICYMIMHTWRDGFLPFLLPCIGKFNKAGDKIKSFGNFLSGLQKEYDALLTPEQRELNSIALELYKQVEKLPQELIHEDMSYNENDGLSHVYKLWQKAIPLLQQQHCYIHPYFHRRQLKGKPSFSWLKKINVQKAVPVIEFKLTDKGAFYQLEMKPVINGKAISNYEMISTFFISEGDNVYLLASVRDAAIAEWMEKSKNKITIFKKQFARFESTFLHPLEKYYPVKK